MTSTTECVIEWKMMVKFSKLTDRGKLQLVHCCVVSVADLVTEYEVF